MHGLKDGLSLSEGDSGTIQKAGPYKGLPSSSEYERHHIPSKAALSQFDVDTDQWPCICLVDTDHALTDSYRGKQGKKGKSYFPDNPSSGKTYKEESIEMIDKEGGFSQLIIDEVLNIRRACGEKYDKAIGDYIDLVVDYVNKHGIPKRRK